MSPKRAYGGTTVTVPRSQEAARKILIDAGADRIGFAEAFTPKHSIGVEFIHQGLLVRIAVPVEDDDTPQRVWRVLHWALKSRFEAIDAGLEEFAQAFLAHIVDPSTGVTIYDNLRPAISGGVLNYEGGLGISKELTS